MKLFLTIAFALTPFSLFAEKMGPVSKEDRRSEQPVLTWHASNDAKTEHAEAPTTSKKGPDLTFSAKNGTREIKYNVPALQITTFRGDVTYNADLPSKVRDRRMFVNLRVSATPGTSPGDGSVVNIDGAIFTFVEVPQTSAAKARRARLFVRDVSKDGAPTWNAQNWIIALDSNGRTSPSLIGIHLDYKNLSWTLYHNDLVVTENLPLLPTSKNATVSVCAGKVKTDSLLVKDLAISGLPHLRPADLRVPAQDGQIDVEKAIRDHDPHLLIVAQKGTVITDTSAATPAKK